MGQAPLMLESSDLAAETREAAAIFLQARLSDALDLRAQLRHAAWNVRGADMLTLGALFGRFAVEIEGCADRLAERIRCLGDVADGRIQTVADATTLYEYTVGVDGPEAHLNAIGAALSQFARAARADVERATDSETIDLLGGVARSAGRQAWLVGELLASGPSRKALD